MGVRSWTVAAVSAAAVVAGVVAVQSGISGTTLPILPHHAAAQAPAGADLPAPAEIGGPPPTVGDIHTAAPATVAARHASAPARAHVSGKRAAKEERAGSHQEPAKDGAKDSGKDSGDSGSGGKTDKSGDSDGGKASGGDSGKG